VYLYTLYENYIPKGLLKKLDYQSDDGRHLDNWVQQVFHPSFGHVNYLQTVEIHVLHITQYAL